MKDANLIRRMRALADDGHPMSQELREKADALDEAITKMDAKAAVVAWARARKTLAKALGKDSLFGL